MPQPRAVLCLSSYFKGNRFLRHCRDVGRPVYLLTVEALRDQPWDNEALLDRFLFPSFGDRRHVVNAVAYLLRSLPIDRIVALDDFDVELAADLHEHFRLPGLGDSAARLFRDKLAMRTSARSAGVLVPEFVGLVRHEDIGRFLAQTPPPWLIKPRSQAGSIGIGTFHDADAVWRRVHELGDDASFHLLERFVPGDLYHVDSLVADGEVVFAEVGRYQRPLLEVYQGGGVFASRTVPRGDVEAVALRELNARILKSFGLDRGASHTEFLRSHADGSFYFIETSARVGGAGITDMVEAATGLNPWDGWADLELAGDEPIAMTPPRQEYGAVVVSLARQEKPDSSSFNDPEVYRRLDVKHHIGLVLRSPDPNRIDQLLTDYIARIQRDWHAALPPADKATL
jgi:hypothetical protein